MSDFLQETHWKGSRSQGIGVGSKLLHTRNGEGKKMGL